MPGSPSSPLGAVRRHPRITALVLAAAVAFGVFAVALARSRTAGCEVPPPVPAVDAQLRSLGDFDQPYDGTDRATLQDAAARAAVALYPDLGQTQVGDPVRVAATGGQQHDALVIPLSTVPGSAGTPHVIGLVAFLLDCSGRAYYGGVDDVLRTDQALNPPLAFPAVPSADAARRLGVARVELVYTSSPFRPMWRDPAAGRTVPAT